MDIKDGHGLKLEKVGPTFSSLNAMPVKIAITLKEHLVYWVTALSNDFSTELN